MPRPPSSEIHAALLDAAGQLFYERGIGTTGVETVAGRAGVGKPALYRHFVSKAGLVDATLAKRDPTAGNRSSPPLARNVLTRETPRGCRPVAAGLGCRYAVSWLRVCASRRRTPGRRTSSSHQSARAQEVVSRRARRARYRRRRGGPGAACHAACPRRRGSHDACLSRRSRPGDRRRTRADPGTDPAVVPAVTRKKDRARSPNRPPSSTSDRSPGTRAVT